jgi:DNA-binding MarR family transcriptional regulator
VLHEAAAALMRQTVQGIAKDIDGRLREHRLTLVQRRALTLLSEGHAVTPGDVSLALETDAGATTRLLIRLVAKGMCRRHRDNGDRRSVHLEITELGRSTLEVTQGTVTQAIRNRDRRETTSPGRAPTLA